MKFRFYIVDFKKLDLKGITKFCSKFDSVVKMSVKMDSNGIGIKIYDEKRNAGIAIYDVQKLTAEDKEMVLGDQYDNEDTIEKVFLRCDHEFMIDANSSDEVRLAYLFAMYISSCTDMLLVNLSTQQMMVAEEIKKINEEKLEKYAKQYDIREKYMYDIKKWSVTQVKAFHVPTIFWIGLIFLAIIAVSLFMVMLVAYDITNPWMLGSPFILIGIFVLGWVFYNIYLLQISNKKLSKLYYEYESELCELWDERMPKKPSGKIVGFKGKVINVLGISILPTLIIGSVLMALDQIIWGLVVVIFPWVSLITIKTLITDVDDELLYKELSRWLEECFRQDVPNEVIAVNFDLKELGNNKWEIDFVWCDKFDERNSMWTRNNACLEGRKTFSFQYTSCWEGVQELIIKMLKKYLESQERTIKIRLFKAMTAGFTDGSVFLIYKNGMIVE